MTSSRFARWSGAPPTAGLCSSGADAEVVTLALADPGGSPDPGPQAQGVGLLAVPGLPVQVEAGAAFSVGATLQSDGTGRAITWASGAKVARALEAATAAGQVKWVVLLSGR
ncbi:MAG TPA: capsid cement protein [Gemmatimonadaceae bacterium]|nr:capsid cement protein [Gemmatimonadaceae bacterium]